MSIKKKTLALFLCIILIVSENDSIAFKASVQNQKAYETKLDKFVDTLSAKTPNEMVKALKVLSPKDLNAVISKCKTRYEKQIREVNYSQGHSLQKEKNITSYSSSPLAFSQGDLQAAWIAAALIAYEMGYPLSATLVIHSVINEPYTEYTGSFSSVLPSSPSFINVLHDFRSSGLPSLLNYQELSFPRYEVEDLYFSLHAVSSADFYRYYNSVTVHLLDIYDFDLSCSNSLFVNIVNDWAWLCMHADVLNVISVNITFSI